MSGRERNSSRASRTLLGLIAVASLLVSCGDDATGDDDDPAGGRPGTEGARGGATDGAGTGGGADGAGTGGANAPLRVRSGDLLLFAGDSLAAEGAPPYPTLLAEDFPELTVTNLAEPGSSSGDWAPGGGLFEQRLAPELDAAAMIFLTVGGNDLEAALGGSDGPDAANRAEQGGIAAVRAALARIEQNIGRTIAAIRRRNPKAAVIYVSYPDYSSSRAWREAIGAVATFGLDLGLEAMVEGARRGEPDVVVEMLGPSRRAGVDGLLADLEHLGPSGHRLYADVLGRRLGG